MSSLGERIEELIEQEVAKQVQAALSNYADMISKSYKIPLSLLLRDLPKVETVAVSVGQDAGITPCLGLRSGNRRCKMNGKYDGYCRHHLIQKQKSQPVKIQSNEVRHTHGFPPFHQDGCPACDQKPPEPKKQLIDFTLVFNNE
jgi:hypothetical protein